MTVAAMQKLLSCADDWDIRRIQEPAAGDVESDGEVAAQSSQDAYLPKSPIPNTAEKASRKVLSVLLRDSGLSMEQYLDLKRKFHGFSRVSSGITIDKASVTELVEEFPQLCNPEELEVLVGTEWMLKRLGKGASETELLKGGVMEKARKMLLKPNRSLQTLLSHQPGQTPMQELSAVEQKLCKAPANHFARIGDDFLSCDVCSERLGEDECVCPPHVVEWKWEVEETGEEELRYTVVFCGVPFAEFNGIESAVRMALSLYFIAGLHYGYGPEDHNDHCWLLEVLADIFRIGENPPGLQEKLEQFEMWLNPF